MTKRSGSGLSKSLILKGLQCPKALWLSKNPPDFELPPHPDREAKFTAGTQVGILARQLFPGGVEVPYEGLSFPAQLARTKELIAQGTEIIYEASFSFSAIFIKADILVRRHNGWQLYEVKMGTSVKPVNLDDVAIQHYVLNGCELKITNDFLTHINTDYIRQGDIDVQRLFTTVEITNKVMARLHSLPEIVQECRQTLTERREPCIHIGPQCHTPYECEYIPYCWQHIPKPSIFDLHGQELDKFSLYRKGYVHFSDLPVELLNDRQRQQVEATLQQADLIDRDKIRDFLNRLWYPIVFLELTTISSPIPPFDRASPYELLPFQFSLHVQQAHGAEAEHYYYLAEPDSDPRFQLLENLLTTIPEQACILIYNQSLAKAVLCRLAEKVPSLAEKLLTRVANIRDLMEPFQQRYLYCWQFNGSSAINNVLSALAPELSHANQKIADRQTAQRAYQQLKALPDIRGREVLTQALIDFCRLDTLAMIAILNKLREIVDDTHVKTE